MLTKEGKGLNQPHMRRMETIFQLIRILANMFLKPPDIRRMTTIFQLIRILANMLPNQVAQNANKQTIHEGDKQLH